MAVSAALTLPAYASTFEWLSFVLILPIGFGLGFQLPLVMLFLERIGIFDVEDFDRFRALMGAALVNDRWQADMAKLIDPCTDPATGFHRRLDEVFRLD